MDYQKARSYIDEAHRFDGEIGLDTIQRFLARLGNPQDDLQFVHIAGTNGKGSVGAYMASVLSEGGWRVGRFLSPTLYDYRERIQVDGRYIEEEAFGRLMDRLVLVMEEMKREGESLPSPFEIETALSFFYFREKQCDLVLLECGMGGRLDATNVIRNTKLAVITSISMDHMEYLGYTLAEIARQKAGILKPQAAVVTCPQKPEAAEVIRQACLEGGKSLRVSRTDQIQVLESDLDHTVFRYGGRTLTIHLAGAHQLENAALALTGLEMLMDQGYTLSEEQIQKGMAKTQWSGRFTVLRRDPYFVVDGAHNPDAAEKLKKSIQMYFPGRRLIFLMGVLKDKQYEKIISILGSMASVSVAMETPDNPRALPAVQLAQCLRRCCPDVRVAESLKDAVEQGLALAHQQDVIVAFGSLSFIGELTRILTDEPAGSV